MTSDRLLLSFGTWLDQLRAACIAPRVVGSLVMRRLIHRRFRDCSFLDDWNPPSPAIPALSIGRLVECAALLIPRAGAHLVTRRIRNTWDQSTQNQLETGQTRANNADVDLKYRAESDFDEIP
jgi:hypothetical protein